MEQPSQVRKAIMIPTNTISEILIEHPKIFRIKW